MRKQFLLRELAELCTRNKDGSFSTQAARKDILIQAGKRLLAAGFRDLPATGLKQKHIQALLNQWRLDGLSDATLKNRVAHLRWWSQKIGKHNLIPRTNAELGIGRRRYVTNVSKARDIAVGALDRINDERLRASLELQAAFGLRREECLKFQPMFALDGRSVADVQSIRLKDSWCKGGRAREIPIINERQREVLARALAIAGAGSMIDKRVSYKEAVKRYENATRRAGLSRLHGLRHLYAQNRYRVLTGWEPPSTGGPSSRQLTGEQRIIDGTVRLQISEELGHSREAITAVYLGR
jgi:site-specific recombinase XerC